MTSRHQPVPWQQKAFAGGSADTELTRRGKPASRKTPNFKYAVLPLWIVEHDQLSSHAVRVFALMAGRWRNQFHDNVWPSHCSIAKRLAISVTTVRRSITELVQAGALSSARPHSGDNHGRTCNYTLHFEPPAKDRSLSTSEHRSLSTSEHRSLSTSERQNQTQRTKPKEPNVPSSLKKQQENHKHSPLHHQPPAPKAPDDGQPFDEIGQLETCAGPDQEPINHAHVSKNAVARHLELFLGHTFAHRFVQANDMLHINQALQELRQQKQLKNPVGWLVTRVAALEKGAGVLAVMRAPSIQETRYEKHRRWGEQVDRWANQVKV